MIGLKLLFAGLPLVYRVAAVVALIGSLWAGYAWWRHSIYQEGFRAGAVHVQDEWNESVRKEIEDGNKISDDARRDVERAGAGGMSDDPWNRDNRK